VRPLLDASLALRCGGAWLRVALSSSRAHRRSSSQRPNAAGWRAGRRGALPAGRALGLPPPRRRRAE
jgi:hypothetical protein